MTEPPIATTPPMPSPQHTSSDDESVTDASAAPAPSPARSQRAEATRRQLQRQALHLFLEQGYQATTVEQIAAAAGVSHMTFFRHFPTKDHVVLSDEFDPLLPDLLAQRPHDEPALQMIRHTILHGLQQIYPQRREDLLTRWRLLLMTPALRERQAERTHQTHQLLVAGLSTHPRHDTGAVHTHAVAAAGLAAASSASLLWAQRGGVEELPDLIDAAFTALNAPTSR